MKFMSSGSLLAPEYFADSAWDEHAPFAFWMTEVHRPHVFVELGAHNGFSYCCFCQAVERLGLDTKAFAVDTWAGDEHAGFYDGQVFHNLKAYHEERYGGFSKLLRMSFDEAVSQFDDGSIDLLHIDGRHFYEDVKHDFETWAPKLSSRGVVLFHDTMVRQRGFGVYKFWREVKENYPNFEFSHGHGLGVLGVGNEFPIEVADLFQSSSLPVEREIRNTYSRLGKLVAAHAEISQHKMFAEKTLAEMQARNEQVRKLAQDVHNLERQLQSARRKPVKNLRRYVRWRFHSSIIKFDRLLTPALARHVTSRIAKYSPEPSRHLLQDVPRKKTSLPSSQVSAPRLLNLLARQRWLFSERRISKFKKSLDKRLAKAHRPHQSEVATSALFSQLFASASGRGAEYVPFNDVPLQPESRMKAIAFYLPQFHPIPENDRWWGKGFTEWTNVTKATPQFTGHYQPRLPDELGFYDLRLPEVQKAQVELAKHYGLYGFCFHYYWFSGRRRLLERPLNQYLSSDLNFPFCICWANENWTRRWDGSDSDILMEQRYDEVDDLHFIEDLEPVLRDERYIRLHGRVLIIVYRVDRLPDPKRTANKWREYCIRAGLGNPYLVAAQSFEITDPRPFGFDSAVQFPPHQFALTDITEKVNLINDKFSGRVYDYGSLLETSKVSANSYKLFQTVMPSWDTEARCPGRGQIVAGSSPALYRDWLTRVCASTDARNADPDTKLVFINAWNEWAEGAHLEPDRRYGYAYLEATKSALAKFPETMSCADNRLRFHPSRKTAVICHLFYHDQWMKVKSYLQNISEPFDLHISITSPLASNIRDDIYTSFPNADIYEFQNRGRDIGPFSEILKSIDHRGYNAVCKIHTKKSPHRQDGEAWCDDLLFKLLGSREKIDDIIKAFGNNKNLAMIGPSDHLLSYKNYTVGMRHYEDAFKKRLAINPDLREVGFFAGSMFWFRPSAFRELAECIEHYDFEREMGQVDGTLAHYLERLFTVFCIARGYEVLTTEDVIPTRQSESKRARLLDAGYMFAKRSAG